MNWQEAACCRAYTTQGTIEATQRAAEPRPAGEDARAPISRKSSMDKVHRCGPDRDRTDDLDTASVALSQLSYGPLELFSGLFIGSVGESCKSDEPLRVNGDSLLANLVVQMRSGGMAGAAH